MDHQKHCKLKIGDDGGMRCIAGKATRGLEGLEHQRLSHNRADDPHIRVTERYVH